MASRFACQVPDTPVNGRGKDMPRTGIRIHKRVGTEGEKTLSCMASWAPTGPIWD